MATKKPIILSTGTSSFKEIKEVMKFIKKKKNLKKKYLYFTVSVIILHHIKILILNNISILKEEFNCTVGLSDHSINNDIAVAAIGAGAEIFEKHIAIKASKKSPDFKFSLLENQIGEYRKCLNETYEMFKKNKFYRNKSEKFYKNFRRSIYAIRNIRKGIIYRKKY